MKQHSGEHANGKRVLTSIAGASAWKRSGRFARIKPRPRVTRSAGLPDQTLIARFMSAQRILLAVAGLIAAVVLCGWMFPGVGKLLPESWDLMKSNTAIVILSSIVGLELRQRSMWHPSFLLSSRLAGGFILLLAGSALLGHWSGHVSVLDVLLARASEVAHPGPMSIQTAVFFSLMGMLLAIEPEDRNVRRIVSDALTAMLVAIVLIVLAGYVFGAMHLFGQSMAIRTSPQTLCCMAALTFSAMVLRLYAGPFAMLVSIGIGSHIARITVLWAMLIPFALVSGGIFLMMKGGFTVPHAGAITASAMAMLLLVVVFWMARRINWLELELRDQALTDEMTGIHNRRAFYMLGEYLFHEGKRNNIPLTVLFFDLDGLKRVNDTLGHDAGSELICDFTALLSAVFRESDVVARLGGDEFAVMARMAESMESAGQRLEQAVEALNAEDGRPYRISYSMGQVTSHLEDVNSFGDLVARADAAMYEQKKQKKDHPA